MNIYTIYMATNIINGKSYIGFDSGWPKRKSDHKRESKKKNNTLFYNAIRKYGWDNFVWTVLYQSKESTHCLEVMEPYFILEYQTFFSGYNMTIGGNGKKKGYKDSEETKKKKSVSHIGKKMSKQSIEKRTETRKGYKHSIETKLKLSQSKIGKKAPNKGINARRCSCIVCHKEVDVGNLGRHHKHLPKLLTN